MHADRSRCEFKLLSLIWKEELWWRDGHIRVHPR